MNILLTGVLALLVAAPPAATDRMVSKTLPLAANGHVTIDTYKGSINVTSWDRPEVSVEARILPDDSCGSEKQQREWEAATRVDIESDGAGVTIRSNYDELEGRWSPWNTCTSRPFVHYRIRLPATAALKIHDYKSDTDVRDFAGRLTLDTYKGSAALVGLSGALDVTTYKGEVRAVFARLSGDVRAETYKGDVTVTLPSAAAFDLRANAGRRGDFVSDFEASHTIRASRRSEALTSTTVNSGGPRVELSTYKGKISVRRG